MKNRDLVRMLEDAGFVLKRHGNNHDIYQKGNIQVQVPRHREINELTAQAILREAGLK